MTNSESGPQAQLQKALRILSAAHQMCTQLGPSPQASPALTIQRMEESEKLQSFLELAVASTLTTATSGMGLPLTLEHAAAQEAFQVAVGRFYQEDMLRHIVPYRTRNLLRGMLGGCMLAVTSIDPCIVTMDRSPSQKLAFAIGQYLTADPVEGSMVIGDPRDRFSVPLFGTNGSSELQPIALEVIG